MAKKKNWIAGAIKRPGSLRAKMHVKEGETIPVARLKEAAGQGNTLKAKQARLALTLRKMGKGK